MYLLRTTSHVGVVEGELLDSDKLDNSSEAEEGSKLYSVHKNSIEMREVCLTEIVESRSPCVGPFNPSRHRAAELS